MKALDTPVLLAFLEGSPRVREQVRKLRGVELATTEANLLELAYLASFAPLKARAARLASIGKLRQRLTVLPIDPRATLEASRRLLAAGGALSPWIAAMLGALEAGGCDELLTDDPRGLEGSWRFRTRKLPI